MKRRFLEYLLESTLSRSDFSKHNYQYLKDVLVDIVNNGEVGLGENAADTKVQIDKSIQQQFKTYINAPNLLDVDEFNKIAAQNSTPFRWSKIWKGKYSGQEHQSAGEYAEAAVAYIFNALNGDKTITEADDDTYAEIAKVLSDKNVTSDWIKSSRLSAEKLHDEVHPSKKYKAAHVDGKDISKVPQNILDVAKVFKGKQGIQDVFGDAADFDAINSLYSVAKDTWNKADIVLVDKNFDIKKELAGKHFVVSDEINAFLNSFINQKKIIPVSLKMIPPKATLEQIKFEKEGKLDNNDKHETEVDRIQSVQIVLPKTVNPEEKYVGTCYIKTNNGLRIDFRHGTATRESLNIEIKLKHARGGKALSELKRKLNLASGFYKHESFKDEKDFISQVKTLTGIKLSPAASLNSSDPKWFIRPAFKGLVALLKVYHSNIEQNTTKHVDLIQFFKLLYNCASGANSESIFWLLSMK